MKMIVGLGNPGKEYVGTRHNAGFDVIDSLAEQLGIEVKKKKFGALIGTGQFNGKKLILVKPVRFMNCSGQVIATVAGFYKLDLEDLLVISDEMAIEAGKIRVRAKGSAGGHNGLADIIEKLGTGQFSRLRVGIGQSGIRDTVNFVLAKPTPDERELIAEATAKA
ncbi:MAG: aminoacyl-tRNA hydrolase, partial [Planctomycetota bacterium]